MTIEIINSSNPIAIAEFVDVKNKAYKARSNDRIPFIARTEEDLQEKLKTPDDFIAVAVDAGRIIGGIGCRYIQDSCAKVAELFWLCVDPEEQGKGIANQLMTFAEERAITDGSQFLTLDVFCLALPAVCLYKKRGFRPLKVWAHRQGTCCLVKYIKSLHKSCYGELRRLITLLYSRLKYFVLFHNDNSPTWIYRLLFKVSKA